MKKQPIRSLIIAVLVGSFILVSGGCTKKAVIPPSTSSSSSSNGIDSQGKDINYPPAENGFNEGNIAGEENLDDTANTGVQHLGSMAIDGGSQEEQTDEYKAQQGRSTPGLAPVYFDFDQATIKPDMAEIMIRNAEALQQVNNTVIIEGNSDDRGTNEYNLALAERRAINVRDYLVNLGVSPGRIRTVSYGEERPLFLEQTEYAWSKNRRADFVLE
ncbi:MAG: OmpA family protein [Desulfobulbaceae bacterium]|nr:MAG: OmpA family protein [Desulfobulbaceae bacterium]